MNTNIVISLDKRRKKKDGTYPIIMRLSHNRKSIGIPLGISVQEKDWDAKRREVKKSYKGVSSITRLNNLILKKKAEAMEMVTKLEDRAELQFMSVKQIKERITHSNTSSSIFAFSERLMDEMKQAQRFGNARTYKLVLGVLKTYNKNRDLRFEEINYAFLKKWETSHLSRGNSLNSLSVYMRTIRAIYNQAIKAGLIEKQAYPFDKYKIKSTPTEKRAISVESLKKIVYLVLDKDHKLFHVRNLFVTSYLLYGMNFIDMAFIKKSDIIDGRIKYRRKKTAKLYDIKVTEQLQGILDFYTKESKPDSFLFPIIKRTELGDQYKDVDWARKQYNRYLKKNGEL